MATKKSNTKKRKTISVQLETEDYESLKILAKMRNITMTQILRNEIRDILSENKSLINDTRKVMKRYEKNRADMLASSISPASPASSDDDGEQHDLMDNE